jgi:sugar phosphate isomerase/epimerase
MKEKSMRITGIGIDEDVSYPNGDLSHLEKSLAFFVACGFDNVELMVHQLNVIINGGLRQQQVERIRRITEKFPFTYTVHAPLRLNLAFPQRWPGHPSDLTHEQDVFIASLDFCAALGAKVMVYHSGLIALYQVAFGFSPLPTDDELERAREQEVNALRGLMPLAAERGVIVGMENRDPHPWEAVALIQAGLPPDHLLKYHAGMSMPDLVRQVEAVNHPNLGITLDFGHLFLAANYCGFDYLEAIRQAAPHIRHLHGSDNFGRLGGVFSGLSDRIPYGDGDVHLPPGWGDIPYPEAFSQLSGYEGLYVLELPPRFRDDFPEILAAVRQTIGEATE